ncbi:MAG: GTPase Era [Fimbriimonadaceae bacterium]
MAFKAGLVALIGKPNVGKSTLLNHIVGQKVSIVSNKPQTTRRRVLGIAHGDGYQIAFLDTPGIHDPHTRLGKSMVDAAKAALSDIDLIVYVADSSGRPGELDKQIAEQIKLSSGNVPTILCLNKMDLLKADAVMPNVEAYCQLLGTERYMLTTAKDGRNVDKLVEMIVELLPEGGPLYPEDEYTDQSSRFMVAELIREKVLRDSRQEVPHSTAVVVDEWDETDGKLIISATVYVEKASQRGILIGKQGQFVKKIGTDARAEIEELLQRQVHLDLHIKVREDWRMNPRMLVEMEYTD